MTGVMKSFKEMTLKMEMERESQVGRQLEQMCRGLKPLAFQKQRAMLGMGQVCWEVNRGCL